MRDVRLLLVLVSALAIIIVSGVAVPALFMWATTGEVHVAGPEARAAPEKLEPLPPVPEGLDRLSERFRAVAKHIRPAVVAIGVSKTVEASPMPFGEDFLRRFFGRQFRGGGGRRFEQRGLGSGVIVSADGYILTNNHVVAEADEITVRLSDGREFAAEVIGTDPPSEIAVVQIKADGELPVAKLGDETTMEVGDWVLAVGSPFGLEQTVTSGIISATGRQNVGITEYENFIQTDAAINPGNSGGPLVNMNGEVVGINTAIASRSGGYMGIGFAVPISMAKNVMSRLVEEGEVVRGWLGVSIQPLTPEMAESMDVSSEEGVLISQVFDGTPAAEGGIKAGDVILTYNGEPVNEPSQLQSRVAWTKPGTEAKVVLIRGGKRKTMTVRIATRPEQAELARAARGGGGGGGSADLEELGFQVSGVTPEAEERYGYKPGQGVLVTSVKAGSLASRAGLEEGMLILQVGGKDVSRVRDLEKIVEEADLKRGLPLLVRAGDRQMFMLLKKK